MKCREGVCGRRYLWRADEPGVPICGYRGASQAARAVSGSRFPGSAWLRAVDNAAAATQAISSIRSLWSASCALPQCLCLFWS